MSDISNIKKLKLLPHLELTLGSRVMYQNNNEPQLGLFNGAMGTVVGFYYVNNCINNEKLPFYAKGIYNPFCTTCIEAAQHDYQLPIVLVQFDNRYYEKNQQSFLPDVERVIAIAPSEVGFKLPGERPIIYRIQVPLQLSTCCTIHKVQALTLTNIVWILSNIFLKGLAYVASSRVTSFSGLHLIPYLDKKNLTTEDFNKWNLQDIHDMYSLQRLKQRITDRKLAENYVNENKFTSLDDVTIIDKIEKNLTREFKKKRKHSHLINNNITINISYFGYKWEKNSCAPDTIFTLIHYMYKFHLSQNNQEQFCFDFPKLINVLNDTNGCNTNLNRNNWYNLIYNTVIDNNTLYVENEFMNIVRIVDFYLLSVTNEMFSLKFRINYNCNNFNQNHSIDKRHNRLCVKKFNINDSIQNVINDYISRQFIITQCQSCLNNLRLNHEKEQECISYGTIIFIDIGGNNQETEYNCNKNIDQSIIIYNMKYNLVSAIYYGNNHYKCLIYNKMFNLYEYDGMKNNGKLTEFYSNYMPYQMNSFKIDGCFYIIDT